MTAGGLTPVPGYAFYVGFGKEATWNTAVPPTWFSRWQDGTTAQPMADFAKEFEGDAQPFVNLIYKKGQYWAIKIVEYVRPIGVGRILQACLRSGSDTYTAPTDSTTLALAVAAGATTFESVADLGNTGTIALNFTPGYNSASYEVQTVDLTTRVGAATPWTYTLAAGAKFKKAHLLGDAITSVSGHALTPQAAAYDAFSCEIGYGNSYAPARAIRMQDCVCTQVDITSQAGMPLKVEHTWFGAASSLEAALATVTLEGSDVVGAAGGPLIHEQAGSSWAIDGASTGNAATIKQMRVSVKNSTTWDEFKTEGLTPAYFTPDNFEVEADISVVFQSYAQYYEMYYGSSAATTGAADSYLVGYGSLGVTWTGDAVNSLALSIPDAAYTGEVKMDPKRDGKAIAQAIHLTGTRAVNGGVAPVSFTLNNSQNTVY